MRHWKEKGSLSGVSVHVAVRNGGLGGGGIGQLKFRIIKNLPHCT